MEIIPSWMVPIKRIPKRGIVGVFGECPDWIDLYLRMNRNKLCVVRLYEQYKHTFCPHFVCSLQGAVGQLDGPMTIESPFWAKMRNSKRILLSGAGGGFDIYQGIPLYFTLKAMGKEVFLANYTFCHSIEAEKGFEHIYHDSGKKDDLLAVVVSAEKVDVQNISAKRYFPECM